MRAISDAARRIELDTDRRKLQNDARTILLQGLGGLAVFADVVWPEARQR